VDEVKITEDLQRVRRQAVKKQDQGNDGAVLLTLDELIERIARAEAQVAEADFNFGGWRAIKKRLEAQVAALTEQLQTANKELAIWRSEHDPCPFALENERLTEQVRVLKEVLTSIGDDKHWHYVSSPIRDRFAWFGSQHKEVKDFVKAYFAAARSAAPGKVREDGTR